MSNDKYYIVFVCSVLYLVIYIYKYISNLLFY